MKKYIEIIDGNIELSNIHPYNINNYSDEFMNTFIEDLKSEFHIIEIIEMNKKIVSVKIPKFNKTINFYIDHVDSGGHTGENIKINKLAEITKKISIDFSNKKFCDIIRHHEDIYIVNFYFELTNDNGYINVNKNKYCYIILNPKIIYESKNFQKIKNLNMGKNNSSSRWIKIGDILKFNKNQDEIKHFIFEKHDWKFCLLKPGFFQNFYVEISKNKNTFLFHELKKELFPLLEKINEQKDDIELIINNKYDKTTEKRLIESRLGQGQYRKGLLKIYNNQCVLSSIGHKNILIASHILPWRESDNNQRLDKYNGLLLSSNIDKLFDSLKISFNNDGILVMSNDIDNNLLLKIGVNEWFLYNSIYEKVNKKTCEYLKLHYKLFLKKNKI